jgi:ankyrin repeat protein
MHAKDPGPEDDDRWTPVHLGSFMGLLGHPYPSHSQPLAPLGCPASLDVQNNEGKMPLHVASQHDLVDAMRLLLKHGADADAQDRDHFSNLGRA